MRLMRVSIICKAHYPLAAESRVMLDWPLTSGMQPEGTVRPERLVPLLAGDPWPDQASGRGPPYAFLRQWGIYAYIPYISRP